MYGSSSSEVRRRLIDLESHFAQETKMSVSGSFARSRKVLLLSFLGHIDLLERCWVGIEMWQSNPTKEKEKEYLVAAEVCRYIGS